MSDQQDKLYFPRAAVLGIGLIGASFALALKRAGLVGEVIGVARRFITRDAAKRIGAADYVTAEPRDAVRNAHLVYLATPVGAIPDLLERISGVVPEGCLVTDAGSVKKPVCSAAAKLLPVTVQFVGGHPMAGSERSGPEAATPDLFTGQTYFLVATSLGGEEAASRLAQVVEAIGAHPVLVDAEDHDRTLAATSHLPHAVAMALMLAVRDLIPDARQRAKFSAGGLRDTTRIAASHPELWRDIFLANAMPLSLACQLCADILRRLAEAAQNGNADELFSLLSLARQTRLDLESQHQEYPHE
jgi:prephenate dehydrogenase